ncbi:hypothetical protein VB711_05820 [Cronbergia sp. UHCC 0137]|uniref:hypothetical protein n=1 Tax=Cronbergia sp. UHCC 0137 TaxID=3110239 RepID=UPI002B21924F|nr:hypothetical protein [Cronbergia sp. UHCC 0137]MEA5617356.1 hypothetical protein [Cronbergia sp. UHCC 0137]
MKYLRYLVLSISVSILVALTGNGGKAVGALPPPEDIPEEILRTQIITEARSPIDGKRVTAAQYAQLQAQLQTSPPPTLSSPIREQVFLLRIRRFLLQFLPFLDI